MRNVFLAAAGMLIVSNAYALEECDPDRILKPDLIDLEKNTAISVHVLDKLLNEKHDNETINTSAQYGVIQGTGDRAKEMSSRLKKLLKVDYTATELLNLRLSVLPDNAVKAYTECLKSKGRNVSVRYSGDLTELSEFFLTVNWHPSYPNAPQQSKVKMQVIGGSLDQNADYDIAANQSVDFVVKRVPDGPTQIRITIDGQPSEPIDIPPRPQYRIIQEYVEGPVVTYRSIDTIVKPLIEACVEVDPSNDMVLVPGTFSLKNNKFELLNRRPFEENEYEGEHRACRSFRLSTDATRNYADLNIQGTALVWKAERIDRMN